MTSSTVKRQPKIISNTWKTSGAPGQTSVATRSNPGYLSSKPNSMPSYCVWMAMIIVLNMMMKAKIVSNQGLVAILSHTCRNLQQHRMPIAPRSEYAEIRLEVGDISSALEDRFGAVVNGKVPARRAAVRLFLCSIEPASLWWLPRLDMSDTDLLLCLEVCTDKPPGELSPASKGPPFLSNVDVETSPGCRGSSCPDMLPIAWLFPGDGEATTVTWHLTFVWLGLRGAGEGFTLLLLPFGGL
mmetsp:Transcript_49127/g.116999  ORF Transcript_49127/g.116999 Transcript_49127/m.116999 type:complete len:242 (+) Transcript_49127:3167-3892(+)